jgi:hypothetical protein
LRLETGKYKGKIITFEYNVVRFWELQSRDFLDEVMAYFLYTFHPYGVKKSISTPQIFNTLLKLA